jgi:hypothetical protein
MRTQRILSLLAAGLLGACTIEAGGFIHIDGDGDGGLTDGGPDGSSDPDAPTGPVSLIVSSTTVDLDEAATASFTVALSGPPAAPLLVTLVSSDGDTVAVTPEFVLFGELDWDAPQPVTLSASDDADTDDESATVEVASDDVAAAVVVEVAVADDDVLAIEVTPAGALDVSEGATATLEVSLSAAPAASTVVSIATSAGSVATVSAASLTFTASDWDQAQEVTITGVADPDTSNDTAVVTFSSAVTADETVDVTVVDDDVLGIEPSTTSLGTLTEGAGTSLTVRLTQQPPGNVTVTVTSSDPGALAASPSTLTFTTSDWSTGKPVTVTAPQDVDTGDETVEVALAAAGLTERTVAAAVDDDDTQAIVTAPSSLALAENASGSFTVRLAYAPTTPLTMTVASLNGAQATASPATLSFDASDYDEPRTINVLVPDDLDAADGATAIRLSLLAADLTTDVPVSVADDDDLLIETNLASVALGEGSTATFGVRLTAQPAGTTTVSVSSGTPGKATVAPAPLSFTTANWSNYQTVTVTSLADLDLANDTVTITLGTAGVPNKLVSATITDDDTQRVLVSTANVNVAEGGSTTVGVNLEFQPASTVNVAVASASAAGATAGPTTLTFTTGNWNQAQTVTIAGTQDDNVVQDSTTVSMNLAGATSGGVTVTVGDDDTLGFVLGASTLTVNENSSGSFTVRLSHQPSTTLSASIAPQTAGIYTVSPSTLSFTTGNWNTPQAVTVTPVSDGDQINESTAAKVNATGVAEATCNVTVSDTTVIVNLGWPSYFGQTNTYGSGVIHAFKITIPGTTPVTLDRWGILAYNTGTTQVQMALYSDNGSSTAPAPSVLLASSGAFNASLGEYDVPDTTTLNPGTYWLAWKTSATLTVGESTSAAPATGYCNKTTTWGAALPAPWGSPVCFPQYFANIYLVTYR